MASTRFIIPVLLAGLTAVASSGAPAAPPDEPRETSTPASPSTAAAGFRPGEPWLDDRGKPIEAHMAGNCRWSE